MQSQLRDQIVGLMAVLLLSPVAFAQNGQRANQGAGTAAAPAKPSAPATRQASHVVNRLREEGILAGTDGPHHNVIKLRPPLCFTKVDAMQFNSALDSILGEHGARPA